MMVENDAVEADKIEIQEDADEPLENDELDEAVAVELPGDEEGKAENSEASQSAGEPEPSKQKRRRTSPALNQVTSWFAACGRCSFFLAGYRLISDEEMLETAVANRSKKWLTVPWSKALAELILKTYGSRIDINCYHFEGQCLECHRRFTYQGANKEGEQATFRIALKP